MRFGVRKTIGLLGGAARRKLWRSDRGRKGFITAATIGTLVAVAGVLAGLGGASSRRVAGAAAPARPASGPFTPTAISPVAPHVFRGSVRDLPQIESKGPRISLEDILQPPLPSKQFSGADAPAAPNVALGPMPGPIQNFAGMNYADTCTGGQCGAGWPPDINGDVGPNHYIEAVNDAFAIYSKTGTLLASFTENSLWAGSGAPQCDGHSFGDPVVLYDGLADRWILSQFAFSLAGGNPVSPYYQCIAASRSGDPVNGGWNLYAIRTDTGAAGQPPVGTLNDYGKFGIWTDCLYFAANGFAGAATFNGTEIASFSRADMYAGNALTGALGFIANSTDPFTLIPSNLAGPAGATPPAGTPNYFVSESQTLFAFEVWKFTPGANCGGGGSFTGPTNVSQTSYSVPGANIVPQPNTTNTLDSLGDRLMQKVQYRKVGSAESLWVTHSTRGGVGLTTRPQWAQINVTGGTVATTPVQQQIYTPDTTIYRWMPSIAADKDGNVALGYSTSNGTVPNFPSIAYSGRLAGDPLNQLPQTETQLIAGGGSQTNNCGGNPCHRWGDYTAMSVDPDGCTFWYTNEYYDTQASGTAGNWHTRIGSFKFPSCTPVAPNVGITKSADAVTVNAGSQMGFTVTLSNTGTADAFGLAITDNLPGGTGVAWSIGGGTSSGWSVTGTPPNQSLAYSPTSLAAGASTIAHVVSSTTTSSCGVYNNTASFTTSNDGSGNQSASVTVQNCGPPTPTCNGKPATIVDPPGNHTIVGTPGPDVIVATSTGNKTVKAKDGDNTICTGNGNDLIVSGIGNDWIDAGGAVTKNTIKSGAGDDTIFGGPAIDAVVAAGGNDTVNAGDGKNNVSGGAGDDNLTAGSGNDTMAGNAGFDTCNADGGTNRLTGCEA